jgi:hypothetical protein
VIVRSSSKSGGSNHGRSRVSRRSAANRDAQDAFASRLHPLSVLVAVVTTKGAVIFSSTRDKIVKNRNRAVVVGTTGSGSERMEFQRRCGPFPVRPVT